MSSFPAIGSTIIELSEIDSTNDYAMQLANGGMAEHGTVIITNFQTKGKGQQGNQWVSEAESNLLFSVILDTSQEDIQSQFLLNAAFCASIAQMLMEHFELSSTSIKWPNDIFVQKKKIAGILIENLIRGHQWQFAIVGIGINVNQFQFDSSIHATSICSESGAEVSLIELRKIVFEYLNVAYQDFSNNKKTLLDEYNCLLHGIDEQINFTKDNKKQSGILYGAAPQGFLKIDDKQYRHGEIKLLL